jgi:hypothetical protein
VVQTLVTVITNYLIKKKKHIVSVYILTKKIMFSFILINKLLFFFIPFWLVYIILTLIKDIYKSDGSK